MRAATPHSPLQHSPYERCSVSGPYAHLSSYPSPAKTEADHSNYMADPLALYYTTVPLPSQPVYPISPPPSDTWPLTLTNSVSPNLIEGRGWTESYEPVGRSPMNSWEQPFQYAPSGPLVETVPSPAHSESQVISQRASISSSFDHSAYSQDGSDSNLVKVEPYSEWKSNDDPAMGQQPLTVSPQRLRHPQPVAQSEGNKTSTCTARTRSRSKTTPANANFKCDLCNKLFKRGFNHRSHMLTHDPKRRKPNVCQFKRCEWRFVRNTDLQRHVESVHQKAKNWGCLACGNNFARKDTLKRHTEDGCPRRFEVVMRQAQPGRR